MLNDKPRSVRTGIDVHAFPESTPLAAFVNLSSLMNSHAGCAVVYVSLVISRSAVPTLYPMP